MGFLKGRSVGESVRLIDSIITYAESQNISGILGFTDFEKAFDTLEWNLIEVSDKVVLYPRTYSFYVLKYWEMPYETMIKSRAFVF